ncbi:MAG: response regulator [Blautia sp.]|nr:response regulator [Blautia sp.]
MKRLWTVFVNVFIVAFIVIFVYQYSIMEKHSMMEARTEAFENVTVAMGDIATKYLEGEQLVCDSWARYIQEKKLSMEEAIEALRLGLVRSDIMAHLVYMDTQKGLSTQGRGGGQEDALISYKPIGIMKDLHYEEGFGAGVHITRAYTNPINGVQSLGFYHQVSLFEEGESHYALLFLVVPVKRIEKGWEFPAEGYQSAELSLIDAEGNYILRGKSFKNTNFFEFYKSYNVTDAGSFQVLKEKVVREEGTLEMNDSKGRRCVIGYAPVNATDSWSIISYVRREDMVEETVDFFLLGFVAAALLLLLLVDMLTMYRGSVKLKKATLEAEEANQAKTDFLSAMSHDIRTPMNAIVGLTTIASKNVADRDTVQDCLKKIQLASNHLLTLINDILDISKVESGRLSLSPLTFSLVETAENLVNMSQPMVKEKQMDFDFCVGHLPHEYVHADQLRLNQIYINLLSNAIKYTPASGKVRVEMREEVAEDTGMVTLTYIVADTGMGMSKDFMKQMYEPFSRQSGSQMKGIQGTGLGLAITRRMVELMDGTITCESEVGKGTNFTVTLLLPVAEQEENYQVERAVSVLLVDDDPMLLESAKEVLVDIGTRPEIASSGQQALKKLLERSTTEDPFEVVILDWKMPDMDGVEVAREIRRQVGEEIPILVISAYDWSDIEEDAKAAGVNSFVSKPLFRSTLYEKINALLGVKKENE